jgi:hypothetical protein
MKWKNRARTAFQAGVFCAIFGPVLGGLAYGLLSLLSEPSSVLSAPSAALGVLSIILLFAVISVAPFGFIAGLAGGWWLACREEKGIAKKRLCFESAGSGALLGATYPFAPGLGDIGGYTARSSEYLQFHCLLGAGVGLTCGLLLALHARDKTPEDAQSCPA